MARRRPRGTLIDPIGVHWDVEREAKDKFAAAALAADVSEAVMFEAMVQNLELNDSGVPVWWTPLPRAEELPINTD